jgi:hypothetical protein
MGLRRRNEGLALVDSWIEEALFSDDTVHNTGIIAKRVGRDSYSQERPLLSVCMAPSAEQPSELKELSPLLESESAEIAEWMSAFEPSLRYASRRS